MPFDKLGNAFVLVRAGGRMKPLSRYAEFCERRKQAREDYRQDSRRHHEHQAVRYRNQPAFQQNICLALSVIRADQLVLESDFTTKIAAQGFSVRKESGPASTTHPSTNSVEIT